MRWSERERSRRDNLRVQAKELRAQRLAFATGSLLAWGTTFIGLHAFLRTMQAPQVEELAYDSKPTQAFDFGSVDFIAVSYLVGFGLSVVFVAALYLIDHGLSLWRPGSASPRVQPGQFLYHSLFALMAFVAFFLLIGVPMLYGYVAVDRFLVFACDASVLAAATIAKLVVALGVITLLAVAGWCVLRPDPVARLERLSAWAATDQRIDGRALYGIGLLGFGVIVVSIFASVAIKTAFTAELSTSKRVYDRATDRNVEILVLLGGSTSDPSKIVLTLHPPGQTGSKRPLKTNLELAPGQHLALVPVGDLAAGTYRVDFRYDPEASFPFLNFARERDTYFVVGP